MESISPNIFVKDIHETITFYKHLGFKVESAVPDPENPVFALMTCGGVSFMFQTFESIGDELPPISRSDGGSLLLYIKMNDIQPFYERVGEVVPIYRELEKTFYGATEFSIIDNNNYILTFAAFENESA